MTPPPGTGPESSWTLPAEAWKSLPVVAVSSAVLCRDCLGDWCESCDWTGLDR